MSTERIPSIQKMMELTYSVLRENAIPMNIIDISQKIKDRIGLSDYDEQLLPDNGGQPIFYFRSSWARSYLKKIGLIENPERGVWAITSEARKTTVKEAHEKINKFREFNPKAGDVQSQSVRPEQSGESLRNNEQSDPDERPELGEVLDEINVTSEMYLEPGVERFRKVIISLNPDQFEYFCLKLLENFGFTEVKLTPRGADGGIDGSGYERTGLFLRKVVFQCKRYTKPVGAQKIRDFRGASQGNAHHALMISASSFTKEAYVEARRAGAMEIDLIPIEELYTLCKKHKFGIIEQSKYEIDLKFFENIRAMPVANYRK